MKGGIDMDLEQLRQLQSALYEYVAQFDGCVKGNPNRQHLRTYLEGQLGSLPRKSVEPIALEAGVPPRTLQEFLAIHDWDEQKVARHHRELVRFNHGQGNAIAIIDETSFPKKGDKTPGVKRQYCGAMGKVDNCVVTVHLGYVAGDFHTLLDGELFLPEDWTADRERCRQAGIPEKVTHRPKWQIGLELLQRSLDEGVQLKWLTADEEYDRVSDFRHALAQKGLLYMMEIPRDLAGWLQRPKVEKAGTTTRSGHTLSQDRVAPDQSEAQPVWKIWNNSHLPWQLYRIKDTEKGPCIWRVRQTRFFPREEGLPGEKLRLIEAEEVLTGEVKYFLSNAPMKAPLKVLLAVGFSRWRIERLFQDGKQEVGLDHFEMRSYPGLMRHLILTMLSLYFLVEQAERLRGKKSVVDGLPGKGSCRSAIGPGDISPGAHTPPPKGGRQGRILAKEQCQGCLVTR